MLVKAKVIRPKDRVQTITVVNDPALGVVSKSVIARCLENVRTPEYVYLHLVTEDQQQTHFTFEYNDNTTIELL